MSLIYHFGDFRLEPVARELWHGSELTTLPKRAFDGLVFLVEHRDRAVSRDELIDALWGKPVEDIQVTQLVMRLRRLLGDDSHEPRFIRAVPGYGYRWIAETEVTASRPVVEADPEQPSTPSPATRAPAVGRHWLWGLALLLLVGVIVYLIQGRDVPTSPLERQPGEAIVVLPLDIDSGDAEGVSWVRLGLMDLIAESLRDAGLPAPPSEHVISVLQAVADLPEAQHEAALREALGAEILVRGTVRTVGEEWIVDLEATTTAGQTRRVTSDPAEVIPAAKRASRRLLAALGHSSIGSDPLDEALSERLQRARAAGLALELETARSILTEAPEHLRDEPELRQELAWVEVRAGQVEASMAISTELLEHPAVLARPRLHAQVLIVHGVAQVYEAGHWPAGRPYFDAAVDVLEDEPWAPELGRALAMRSAAYTVMNRFGDAARDLGRARTLFEAGGDRTGVMQVENYSGNLELERGRPNDALAHFQKAIGLGGGFSHVDSQRANISAMQRAQMQLLRWSDALETSETLWALREQFDHPVDPHRRHSLQMHRVEVLVALGRHREAQVILDELEAISAEVPPHGLRYEMEVRARLAAQQQHWSEALESAARAMELWLSEQRPATRQPVEVGLLHQRASIEVGSPAAAAEMLPLIAETRSVPAYLVARAEWAAHEGEHDRAELYFQQATLQAESRSVPATFVLVADAHARWLLSRERVADALAIAGRVAQWADEDFDSALLQLAVLHASGQVEAWSVALERAQRLAGERSIPADLLRRPG